MVVGFLLPLKHKFGVPGREEMREEGMKIFSFVVRLETAAQLISLSLPSLHVLKSLEAVA